MRRELLLTEAAATDLEQLRHGLAAENSAAYADRMLRRMLELMVKVAKYPAMSAVPAELRELGMPEFRQAWLRHYRLVYRLHDNRVIIYIIADARRDLQCLLARRLLWA